jgi:hypothetical protein
MTANGHAPIDLRDRERLLVETYPWIDWTEPQRVVTASSTHLTCRFCTAIKRMSGWQLRSASVGFASEREFAQHLQGEHAR